MHLKEQIFDTNDAPPNHKKTVWKITLKQEIYTFRVTYNAWKNCVK